MKKYIYMILSAAVLALGFTSCVDEDGPGVPQLKKMHLQYNEYTIDLRSDATSFVLGWIDVTNATYEVSLSNNENDNVAVLSNEKTSGELSTLYMTISYDQVKSYVESAGLTWEDAEETVKDEEGKDKVIVYEQTYLTLNVTGKPIDLNNTALDADGSTASAAVTVKRAK